MPNYQNGKIYRIDGNGLTYIGSTTEPLNRRLNKHRGYIKYNRYCSSSKTFGNGNETIKLIENYPCNNKKELIEREYYWYTQIINCNDISPKQQKNEKRYANWKEKNPESYKKQLECSRIWKQSKKEKLHIKNKSAIIIQNFFKRYVKLK